VNARPLPSSSVGLGGLYRRLSFLDVPKRVPGSTSSRKPEPSNIPLIEVMVNGEVAPVVVNVPDPLCWPRRTSSYKS